MAQFDSLIGAANKAIKSAKTLLNTENPPFNVMYKQYKTLQSFWFRVIEDASDVNNKRLEELCVDLEIMVDKYEHWIKENSPSKAQVQSEENPNNESQEEKS